MIKKQVTLGDIAAICGTSNVTVSKALSGKEGVSDELREKIKNAARELGYIPAAKNTRTELIGNIGVIIPEKFLSPIGTFYWALYNNIVQRLKQDNISCIQENIGDDEEAALTPPNILANGKITGLISLGQLRPEYVKMLMQKTDKLLLLDYYIPGLNIDCIISNGISGGYLVTKHLIENGHKNIGFIGTKLATSSIFDRFTGFSRAMLENGLPVREDWIINDRKINNEHFGEMDFPSVMPTAFVCNCDETAFAAIKQLKSLGYAVPDDISIVGYDNFLISEMSEPPITTIDIDAREIAEAAVEMLKKRIAHPSRKPVTITVNGTLEIKNSVKKV